MRRSYRATLQGNQIDWIDPPPDLEGPTLAEITVIRPESEEERRARGLRAAEALRQVGEAGGAIASIEDPVAWQREIRRDRPLPGREDE
jgi:hypothetical protein